MEACEGEAILQLRKETRQLMRVVRLTSLYLLLLTVVYFSQSVYCLVMLEKAEFLKLFTNPTYANEIYAYSLAIEKMKIVHSLTLASIAIFIALFTYRFKILNQRHYYQLLVASIAVTILFFIPVVYIAYCAFQQDEQGWTGRHTYSSDKDYALWEQAVIRFADWILMILVRSDLGKLGLIISCAIHAQIYFLLFIMQWCAFHVRTLSRKIITLKEASQGTYNSVELINGDQ